MKQLAWTAGAVILMIGLLLVLHRFLPNSTIGLGMNTIEYQGEHIKLTKTYYSYEDYKDDPNNIDPSENARVERLVSQAPVARVFQDRRQMVHAVVDLKFPGYGFGGFGKNSTGNGELQGFEIEIPRAEKDRYLTFRREADGGYTLIDDFVASSGGFKEARSVKEENRVLVYSTDTGERLFVRPLTEQTKR